MHANGHLMTLIRLTTAVAMAISLCLSASAFARTTHQPNIVLVMADDQGWGQTSYNNHPSLKTPHLDAMAANGLRFNRFYASAPVCSPTRASVLTGRSNERTGVRSHGYALHRQERTIAQALKKAGYATGHFGKWHLNGLRGPGAPLLPDDPYHPGHFGFDYWLTTSNFFDLNPLLSRNGNIEDFKGDSSEIIVDEALKFIAKQKAAGKPSLTVIWYGSPHSPWHANSKDRANKEDKLAHHHGELVAMDRSIGALRNGLKQLNLSDNTLIWFNSDNGGLRKNFGGDTVGNLRGGKGKLWEGGIRVPAIIEWPSAIKPRETNYPASTMDITPTLVDLLNLPKTSTLDVVDGSSLKALFSFEIPQRDKPIPFQYAKGAALIDNDYKIITEDLKIGKYELYNLKTDPFEKQDIYKKDLCLARAMQQELDQFIRSVSRSQAGKDYPEGRVTMEGPHQRYWQTTAPYQPYLEEWTKRPEYSNLKSK
jgi:arylsulfatase